MVGVGGGVLIAPVIINACKTIPQRVVAGTSMAAVASTGLMAGWVYWSAGVVDPKSAVLLALAAMCTAPLGASATHYFDCNTLRRMLAYWLFLVAVLLPAKVWVFAHPPAARDALATGAAAGAAAARAEAQADAQVAARHVLRADLAAPQEPAAAGAAALQPLQQGTAQLLQQALQTLTPADGVLLATGCLAGLASGLLGIGGGTIVTPLLAVANGLPQAAVLGTSLCGMVPPSLVALLQHHRLGNVDWPMAVALAAGTLAGSYDGSNLAISAPPGVLEGAFSLGMLFLGRKTLRAAQAAAAKAAQAANAGMGAAAK